MASIDSAELHEFLQDLVQEHETRKSPVLNMLNRIQERYRYIPIEALYELSRLTTYSFADLNAIVSSFEDLTTEPVGEHLILVCDGTACHAVGAVDVIKAIEDELGISCGSTSEDEKYTLKSVYCVGACSLAPIAMIDGVSFGRIKLTKLDEMLASLKTDVA